MLMLYRAYTRSKLDYGCIAYSSARSSRLKILDTIHNLGLRLATGAFRSSPIDSLYVDAGEPSLEYRRRLLCLKFHFKAKFVNAPCVHSATNNEYTHLYQRNNNLQKPLYIRCMQYTQNSPLENIIIYQNINNNHPPWKITNFTINTALSKFKKNNPLSNRLYKTYYKSYVNEQTDALLIYTDGSKTKHGTGTAVLTPQAKLLHKLPKTMSIYNAELFGILLALTNLPKTDHRKITIFTDSLSALLTLNDIYSSHPLVTQIYNKIHNYKKHITLYWLPGHETIKESSDADMYAKQATQLPLVNSQNITLHDIYTLIKETIHNDWTQYRYGLRDNKLLEIKQTVRKWTSSSKTSRREEIVLTHIRIGLSRLTDSYLMNRQEKPTCTNCNQPTTNHILTEVTFPEVSLCRRCGRSSYHIQKSRCAQCGYRSAKLCHYK